MSDAPRLGWWQASDGEWYPPELHPNHRHQAAPQPVQGLGRGGLHHAQVVHPTHHRPGAGDYTVKTVTAPSRGLSAILMVIAVVLGVIVLVGGGVWVFLYVGAR
jgi:hypothetical protein